MSTAKPLAAPNPADLTCRCGRVAGHALTPGLHPGHELGRERPPETEAKPIAPLVGGERAAEGRAEVLRMVEPGTAAKDPATLTLGARCRPCGAVRWRTLIGAVPTVLNPFQDVAMHVVQAKRIGCE